MALPTSAAAATAGIAVVPQVDLSLSAVLQTCKTVVCSVLHSPICYVLVVHIVVCYVCPDGADGDC